MALNRTIIESLSSQPELLKHGLSDNSHEILLVFHGISVTVWVME